MTITPKMILNWAVALGAAFLAAQVFAGEPLALKTPTNKTSYSAGLSIIKNLQQQGGEFNLDMVIRGMKDGLAGENLLMTEEEPAETAVASSEKPAEETVIASPVKSVQEQLPWQVMTLASVQAHGSEQTDAAPVLPLTSETNSLVRSHALAWLKARQGH